jgi:CRP-like cAMP-binding protein
MALDLFNYSDPLAEVGGAGDRILASLADEEWSEFLGAMERRVFPQGTEILKVGDRDRTLYLIASGEVEVVVDSPAGRRRLATVGAGSVVGEMAFFDGAPRSATVVALAQVEVLALRQERFEQLVAWRPRIAIKLLTDLGRVLSQRLRKLNQSA